MESAAYYRAAHEECVWFRRPDRFFLRLGGRAPYRMMVGVATGSMPAEREEVEPGVWSGTAPYSLILTPKGRPVTDLRMSRLEDDEGGALLLDLPVAGRGGAKEHFDRYLPPRFASIEALKEPVMSFTFVGPQTSELLSREALALRVDAPVLDGMKEGEERVLQDGSETGLRVVRGGDVNPPAFDVIGPERTLEVLARRMAELGIAQGDDALWEVLRVERGRPAFGKELDEEVLPPEADLQDRAIDHTKGCYTGQEVIVRIRDRGRVNRRLRGLLLGDVPLPEPGTELFAEGRDRAAGELRSAVRSPRFEQAIGLGYVRREVEPPAMVRLGSPEGPWVQVRALSDDGWAE